MEDAGWGIDSDTILNPRIEFDVLNAVDVGQQRDKDNRTLVRKKDLEGASVHGILTGSGRRQALLFWARDSLCEALRLLFFAAPCRPTVGVAAQCLIGFFQA